MESNQYLIEFYKAYDEDSRLQSKHGSVEFLTTMRYVERYLKQAGILTLWHAGDMRLMQ